MPFIVVDPSSAAAAPSVTIGNPLSNTGRTLEAMRNTLDKRIGVRSDVDSDTIDNWLNEAYYDLCTAIKFPELRGSFSVSVVADQPLYNLPSHLVAVQMAALQLPSTVTADEGWPLDKRDLAYYRRLTVDTGEPRLYVLEGKVMVLYPTPRTARTLVVDGRFRPIKMTSASHSPVIPLEWHEGIELLARMKAHQYLEEWDKATMAENDFTGFVRRREEPEAADDEGKLILSSAPHKYPHRRNRVWNYEADGYE